MAHNVCSLPADSKDSLLMPLLSVWLLWIEMVCPKLRPDFLPHSQVRSLRKISLLFVYLYFRRNTSPGSQGYETPKYQIYNSISYLYNFILSRQHSRGNNEVRLSLVGTKSSLLELRKASRRSRIY